MPYNPDEYSPIVADFCKNAQLQPLGPGTPDRSCQDRLAGLKLAELFAGKPIRDENMARLCLAGLWLRHNFLDESHTIAQGVDTATGSYWHAIMHRREPDAGNSKYWFRRVGAHPVFALLAEQAKECLADHPGVEASCLSARDWDPFAFVDLCDGARAGTPIEKLCLDVQQREWQLLFDHCHRAALS